MMKNLEVETRTSTVGRREISQMGLVAAHWQWRAGRPAAFAETDASILFHRHPLPLDAGDLAKA